jgi:CRISPR system Cascade subunit CasB
MGDNFRHFADESIKDEQKNNHLLLRQWHKSLYDNKGDRAGLRRCISPNDVFMTAGFRRLYQQHFKWIKPDSERFIALACAAGVLAHVQEDLPDNSKTFAKQMAIPKPQSDQPQVSELRFSQLQKSYSWDEFYRRLIRTVKLIGGTVNIVSLTDAIFHWGKEFNGEFERQSMNRLQVRWAADYYQILNDKK